MAKKRRRKSSDEEDLELYPADEQGIIPGLDDETDDELKAEMSTGKRDSDIYIEEGRELQEEDAEIDAWEEGFMQGAEGTGQLAKDALTGEPITSDDDVVELEWDDKLYRFVNEENAEKFKKKKEKEERD